jgi:hypothetical protein
MNVVDDDDITVPDPVYMKWPKTLHAKTVLHLFLKYNTKDYQTPPHLIEILLL